MVTLAFFCAMAVLRGTLYSVTTSVWMPRVKLRYPMVAANQETMVWLEPLRGRAYTSPGPIIRSAEQNRETSSLLTAARVSTWLLPPATRSLAIPSSPMRDWALISAEMALHLITRATLVARTIIRTIPSCFWQRLMAAPRAW